MNDLDYLNQISAGVNKPQSTGFFDKKMKIVFGVLGGVVLLLIILLIAVGGSSKEEPTAASELSRLYSRASSLSKTAESYNKYLRSSSLRSTATSYYTVLLEISSTSSNHLKALAIEPSTVVAPSNDSALIAALNSNLEDARLNGILDRKYASEMYFQIRYLITLEDTVLKMTSDTSLKTYLTSSKDSLSRLQETFYNFSESK